MSNLNTGMRLRENNVHVVLLAITMKLMDLNHILQSWEIVLKYITNVIVPISQPEVNVINGILCCILKTRMKIHEHKSRTVGVGFIGNIAIRVGLLQ